MNIFLWILQALGAFLYGASGTMKVFTFEKVSQDVRSFGALPRQAWSTLGILELICAAGLILPEALHIPVLTVMAAAILAFESVVFIWVHVKYREIAPTVMSLILGLSMAFVAYGRITTN